jgi:hypothetical protein
LTPKTFFTLMLGAPIATLGLLWLADPLGGTVFMLTIAAPAYIPCAIVLAVWFMLTRTHSQLIVATMLAPVLMSVALVIFLIVEDPKEIPLTAERFSQLASVAPFGLVVGGIYVGLAWGIYAVGTKFGIVRPPLPPNNRLERSRGTPSVNHGEDR